MANPEHVEIVKQGAAAIDAWRDENDTHLDLSDAYLRGEDLRDADLRHADLNGTDLRGADLSGTDLRDAYLIDTDLRDAILEGANLRGAILRDVNLSRAYMFDADLNAAKLWSSTFGDVDLAEAKGLANMIHEAPSTIGVDTLFKSRGKISEVFLRGCGLPEALIKYLPSIIGSMEPIQFFSCFVSYSSEDDAFARRLHRRLMAEKLRVWFAPEDLHGGEKTAVQIDTAIRVHDRLLLVLSEKSMTSEWVRREIKRARKKEKDSGKNVLFPITLVPFDAIKAWECLDSDSGEDLAEKVREFHIPDFSAWKQEDAFEKAFAELMKDLRAGSNEATEGADC